EVTLLDNNQIIDSYAERFGIRSVEVKKGQFLINNRPFYFKGFGKHEDTYYNGRGLNEVANVMDFNLIKWIGGNSFRTSHYPYSEEMMQLADEQGIVVIDETTAVGVHLNFSTILSGVTLRNTFEVTPDNIVLKLRCTPTAVVSSITTIPCSSANRIISTL